jgi:hypothetical protein
VIALAVVISPGPDWEARFERLRALVDLDKSPDGVAPLAARIAAGVIAGGIGLFALWIVAVFVVWVLSFPVRLVYSGVSRGVQEASRAEQLHIANELDIFTAQHTVDRQRQKVFGARLCVLAVDSSVWQETVAGMADVCAVPLIDISEPTENVMWEINEVVARFGDRCVFIGDFGRLRQLAAGDEGGVIERLSTFLAGRDVLGYEVDPAGTKRFIHALSSTLAWHTRKPRPSSRVDIDKVPHH